ncbi:MAG TPA: hypothetical protein VKP88_06765 [Candidatus Paceibacterota bacterium]|nr:hypothetical protein [Candidatus Paceibacterota bacterium]
MSDTLNPWLTIGLGSMLLASPFIIAITALTQYTFLQAVVSAYATLALVVIGTAGFVLFVGGLEKL